MWLHKQGPCMPRKAQLVLPTMETCCWREAAAGGDATCGLIAQLIGRPSARVTADACKACCSSFPPSPQLFNPPIASLLIQAMRDLAEAGGNPECSREKAIEIQNLAERSIAIVHRPAMTSTPAR